VVATESKRAGLTGLEDNRGHSSLAVLQEWQLWWKEWGPRIARDVGYQGWVLFLLDSNEKITEVEMLASEVLRNQGCENIEIATLKALRWFENHAESVKKDAPEWAAFLLAAQYGNLCALARLGRELRAKQEQGYTTVVLEHTEAGGLNVRAGGDRFLAEVA
jgi:hypothetical protein